MFLMPDDSTKKKEIEQLRDAEKKYQSFIEKRNELNDMAKVFREERDMIHDKRKGLKEKIDKTKEERDKLVAQMRHHKELRNKLQEQAKKLIEARRKRKGEVFKNLPLRVEELKADVQMLEYRQETVPLTSAEENNLIDTIRDKRAEYERTKKLLDKQEENPFLKSFQELHQKVSTYGIYNSLSQAAIKMTSSGVPDFYQGTELWDFNLVDPDNRRPVDYAKRSAYLDVRST